MSLLPDAVLSYCSALRPLTTLTNSLFDSAPSDISHAYAAIKHWLLLAREKNQKMTPNTEDTIVWVGVVEDEGIERRIWNQLWPPFETVLVASLSSSQGEISVSHGLLVTYEMRYTNSACIL